MEGQGIATMVFTKGIAGTPPRTHPPRKLPTWKGYTIDERLQEFRRVRWVDGNPMMDVIPFASKEGKKLRELM